MASSFPPMVGGGCSVMRFVYSAYVIGEAQKGGADDVARRMEVLHGLSELEIEPPRIGEIAKALIRAHALPEDETTDAYHIATAAYYGMDVLLTWNCRHMANEFTLPKTYSILHSMCPKYPVIITPKRFMEDGNYDI